MFCKDKSSPYIYSMYSNYSKRSDKLQRLREQYARMQRMSDRLMDMKVRQVRLNRLFREIEDIREEMPTNGVVGGPAPVVIRRRLLPPLETPIESESESVTDYLPVRLDEPLNKLPPKPTKKQGKELSHRKSTDSSPTVYNLCYF